MGNTHLNKLLSALNILGMSWTMFKTYENEVGKVIEDTAQESCERATLEERQLTIANIEQI